MNSKDSIRSLCVLASFLAGCSAVTPANFRATSPVLSGIQAAHPVTVVPLTRPDSAGRFNANGITYSMDRNEFSAELARLLEQSLTGAGVPTGGDRTVTVQVLYLDFLFQGPCLLDYIVWLGSDVVFGQQARGDGWNFATACGRALTSAAEQIATDLRTRGFLGTVE